MCVGTNKHVHTGELVLGVRDRHGSLGIIVFIYLPQVTARPGFSFNASLLDRFFIVESAQSVDPRQRGTGGLKESSKWLRGRRRVEGHCGCTDSRSRAHTVKLRIIVAYLEVGVGMKESERNKMELGREEDVWEGVD